MVPSGLKLLNNRTREKVLKESEIVLVFQHSNNKSQNLRQETTRVNVEHNFHLKILQCLSLWLKTCCHF